MHDWYSPIAKHVIAPLYAVRDYGGMQRQLVRGFRESQYLPSPDLERQQFEKLRRIVQHAAARSSFYRERFARAGLDPRSFSLEDFRRVAPLTKSDIRAHTSEILAEGWPREQLIPRKTGGSTSVPLHFFIDPESNMRKNTYAGERNAWAGWLPGDKTALVWSGIDLKVSWRTRLRNRLLTRSILLDTLCMHPKTMHEFARTMIRFRPEVLFGHSHSVYILTLFLRQNGYRIPSIRSILSTSTVLTNTERKVMEEYFQCKVFDRYGCEEVSLIASECEQHNGMHLNVDNLYIEFLAVDGTPVGDGVCGDIHITDLTNKGMPFIRYRIEDAATPTVRKCACGRSLPLIEKVQGRVTDFIVTPEGRLLSGVSILDNFSILHLSIARLQIIQDCIDHLTFRIVRGSDFSDEKLAAFLSSIPEFFGASMRWDFEFVDEIPRERSGKYRFTISKLANPLEEAAERTTASARRSRVGVPATGGSPCR